MTILNSPRFKASASLLGLTAFLLATGAALLNAKGSRLQTPGLTLSGWSEWLTTAGPLAVSLTLARAICLAAIAYLLASIVVSIAASLFRSARASELANRFTIQSINQLSRAAVGATFAVALTPNTAADATTPAFDYTPPILHHVDPAKLTTSVKPPVTIVQSPFDHSAKRSADQPADTSKELPVSQRPNSVRSTQQPNTAQRPTSDRSAQNGGTPDGSASNSVSSNGFTTTFRRPFAEPSNSKSGSEITIDLTKPEVAIDLRNTHTVSPGESLWVIARETLTTRNGSATNAEIAKYVERIIDLNSVKTPHLIHPGQRIELPTN